MTASIIQAATADPRFLYDQDTIKEYAGQWLAKSGRREASLIGTFDTHLVRTRRFAVSAEYLLENHSFAERNREYVRCALELGERAVVACLEKAQVPVDAIDFFISTSCTGFTIPSLDAFLAQKLRMKPTLARLPITEHGCAAGAFALARAAEHVRAHPDHRVLVLSVELASLTFQLTDLSPENVISAGMFGDGAAAALVEGGVRSARPQIVAVESRLFPGTTDLMGFTVNDAGFKIVLSREIPAAIREQAVPALAEFLDRHGLSPGRIDHWLLHPGGRKVVECFEDAFDLGRGGLEHSRNILQTRGNLSSATVLHMLDDFFARGLGKPGDTGVLVAFGPGFCAEMLLLRW